MEKAKICKNNMKLYPVFRTFSYDFLFFYTINFLFLTQVKNLTASQILIIDAFYSFFGIFAQIPANMILEKIGRRKSIILGTVFNSLYLIVVMLGQNYIQLALAELLCALGFALIDVGSPSMLNESIPVTTKKSHIFSKLSGKAASRYYILNAISLIASGFLYNINPFIPIILSLFMMILAFIFATCFLEPTELANDNINSTDTNNVNLKDSFKFIFSSGRLKSLLLFSAIMAAFIGILDSAEIYLVEDLEISSSIIGIIFALLGLSSGIAAKKQDKLHNKLRNKTLSALGFSISIACITSTLGFFFNLPKLVTLLIIIVSFTIKYSIVSLYYVLIEKYISNFTNEKIDSKIYTAQKLCNYICRVIVQVLASIILSYFSSYVSMLIFGATFLILFIISSLYMRKKLGLKPEQYSENEKKYSVV